MREMKDSGIEWIGEIANTHKLVRLKYVAEILDEYRKPVTAQYRNQNADILYDYYGASGIIDKIDGYTIDDHVMLIGEDGANLKLRNLPLMYEVCGKAWINNHAHILKPMKNMDFYYLFYALEALDINNYITGSAQPKLNQENLKEILIPLPSYEVQKKVSSYLDTKCSEIDATAEDIQKEISLLEEYKKSVITEAVTKGLNPDAEMKDSGIEWIGDINPKASLCRLKFFSYMKGRIGWQGLKSEDFIDNGPYCVTGTDFINGKINWDTCYHVSEERYKMDSNIQLKIGDLLVTKDGTIGKLAKVTELPEKACLNSHLLIIRPLNERFTNEYLYYVISSDVFVRYYKYSSTGSTIESLSQDKLGNFIFPVYDLLSQQQIVDYLDTKCSEIDSLIADKKRQLDILADYKKSLIYEYVTGKKEVPVNE